MTGICFASDSHIASDSHTLYATGMDGTLCWWDDWGQSPPRRITAHAKAVRGVMRVPQFSAIATYSDDGTIKFWVEQPAEPTRQFTLPMRLMRLQCKALAVSPDGNVIAAIGELPLPKISGASAYSELLIFDGPSGQLKRFTPIGLGSPEKSFVAFSADGSRVASILRAGAPEIWKTDSGESEPHLQTQGENLSWIGFSPDGSKLAGLGMTIEDAHGFPA